MVNDSEADWSLPRRNPITKEVVGHMVDAEEEAALGSTRHLAMLGRRHKAARLGFTDKNRMLPQGKQPCPHTQIGRLTGTPGAS